jgi:hypothetical protein
MHRQKVNVIAEESSFAIEYYPRVIKLILGSKIFYALVRDLMKNVHEAMQAELITLLKPPSGDDSQLYLEVEQGVKTEQMMSVDIVGLKSASFLTIEIIDLTTGKSLHILLVDHAEFDAHFRRSINNV